MKSLTGTMLFLAIILAARLPVAADELMVGVAETDITPPQGFPMSGYYHERLATGIRDSLKAKAVVFGQGDRRGAFVVCDLIGISRDLYVTVRQQVSQQTGIPKSHIVVSATHSHTAPDYRRHLYEHLADPSAKADQPPYAAKLIEGIVKAVVTANQHAAPVTITAGSAVQQTPVSFNRRSLMADGSVQTWRSADDPNRIRAAGPIDPEIGLLLIRDASTEQPVGLISNFALHLDTVGGIEWSADFPYVMEQALRRKLGGDLVSVFLTGACGDINHSNPAAKERHSTTFIGQSLAETVEAALPDLHTLAVDAEFQVRTTTVNLPLQEVTEADLSRAKELIPLGRKGGKVEFYDHVRAYKATMLDHFRNAQPQLTDPELTHWAVSHAWGGIGNALPADVTCMTLGRDVAIVFLPGEVFVDLGLAIKQASPYRTTLIVELSNCVETFYIPTRAAYAGGSYEVTNSMLQSGSGEMLVEAALRLLRESASAKE